MPEFPLFPFKSMRPQLRFLEQSLPAHIKDPWAKRETWRSHPFFSTRNRIRHLTPGLGIASVAFAGYLAWDYWYMTSGPGFHEKQKWDKWLEERNERMGVSQQHHDHHGH